MKSLMAFIKKEIMEQVRTKKLMILGILFVVFGIMSPVIAKSIPLLLKEFGETLAESGMSVTETEVSAMDSWVQFFKNIPMALIAFVILESGIFTREYRSGTLVLSLTKGLERYKVVISKTLILVMLWSIGYWVCFGITYVLSDYFWDNSVAQNLIFSVMCCWVYGIWVIMLMILFSTLFSSNIGVLAGTGGVVLAFTLLNIIPKIKEYFPTMLMDGNSLIYGFIEMKTYIAPLIISGVTGVICLVVSIPIFNKKHL